MATRHTKQEHEGLKTMVTLTYKAQLARVEVFTAVTMKNVFWDITTQFVLHRRHITSLLQSPAS
jgi:hypothetical protein